MSNKLSREQVEEIWIELREGTPHKKIAEEFGVSRAIIQQVNNGRCYRVHGMRYPIVSTVAKERTPKVEYPIEDSYHVKPRIKMQMENFYG